jgi:serine/threonine-protein kinase
MTDRLYEDSQVFQIDPLRFHRVRTLWVGSLCSVEEVIVIDTGQHAVLKQMHPEHRADPGLAARCINEGLILRSLHKDQLVPGIPRLLELGVLPNGCPALLLQRLGDPLAEHLSALDVERKPDALAFLVSLGHQLARTLSIVHQHGIVHRDLRPDNILFAHPSERNEGQSFPDAYIIDFGLAKVFNGEVFLPISTGEEDLLGTDLYMPPEQWESAKYVTGSADVYSLGVILYQLASGRPPFVHNKRQVLMYQHLVSAPPPLPPRIPTALASIILDMLIKHPSRRPSAQQCADRFFALR